MGKSNRSTKTKDKRKAANKLARRKEKSHQTPSPMTANTSPTTTTKSPPNQDITYDKSPDTEMIPENPPSPTSDSSSQKSSEISADRASWSDQAKKLADSMIIEKPIRSTFHLLKMVSSKFNKEICDDDTVEHEKLNNDTRLTMMFMVPGEDKGIDEEEAPLEAIRRMNAMIKSLINKLPSIRLGPWKYDKKTSSKMISEFPEDVDVVEKYAFDFNRFISPGDRAYCRLHIFYDDSTNLAEINSIISGF